MLSDAALSSLITRSPSPSRPQYLPDALITLPMLLRSSSFHHTLCLSLTLPFTPSFLLFPSTLTTSITSLHALSHWFTYCFLVAFVLLFKPLLLHSLDDITLSLKFSHTSSCANSFTLILSFPLTSFSASSLSPLPHSHISVLLLSLACICPQSFYKLSLLSPEFFVKVNKNLIIPLPRTAKEFIFPLLSHLHYSFAAHLIHVLKIPLNLIFIPN